MWESDICSLQGWSWAQYNNRPLLSGLWLLMMLLFLEEYKEKIRICFLCIVHVTGAAQANDTKMCIRVCAVEEAKSSSGFCSVAGRLCYAVFCTSIVYYDFVNAEDLHLVAQDS